MSKTLVVTGSHGNIGSHIVELLCKKYTDSKIICIDNLYNGKKSNLNDAIKYAKENNNSLKFVDFPIDVYNIDELKSIFFIEKIDYVFHQASLLTLDSKKFRSTAIKTNILGFTNILECCLLFGVKKLIYASSASVYGTPRFFPTTENHDFNDCHLLYGATKVADEFLAKSYADEENLKFVGLRYFNVYGERQSTSNIYTQIVPKWINAIIDKKPITIYGDGLQTMDMIYSRDVAEMNVRAMENPDCYRQKGFEGFINIATGAETTVIGLYDLIQTSLEKYGIQNDVEVIYEDHDPNLVVRRKADTTLMQKYLGNYHTSVPEGIDHVVKHILKERNLL